MNRRPIWAVLGVGIVLLAAPAMPQGVHSSTAAKAAKKSTVRPPATSRPAGTKTMERAPLLHEPNLYLSWRAPFGETRAQDRITVPCTDTARVDTLFLGFETGAYTMGVRKLSVVLYFHPQGTDTLERFWHWKRGFANQGNMLIDFDYAAGLPGELPWQVMGFGQVSYDHRSGRGRLDLSYTVPPADAKGLTPEVRYVIARVRLRQLRADLPGCGQPVCVEIADMMLETTTGRIVKVDRGANRFVSWNAAPGVTCAPSATRGVRTWRPGS